MHIRRFAAGVALAALGLTTAALAVGAGGAGATAPVCKTSVAHLADRPDSGEYGGDWALDTMTRTTVICQTAPGIYHAVVTDDGSFLADHNPKTGTAISPPVSGTIHGGFSQDFTAAADFAGYKGNYDGQSYTGTAPSSSSDWVANVYGCKITTEGMNQDWAWNYVHCDYPAGEKWGNAAAGNTGQIVGAPCHVVPTPRNPWFQNIDCGLAGHPSFHAATFTLWATTGVLWEKSTNGGPAIPTPSGAVTATQTLDQSAHLPVTLKLTAIDALTGLSIQSWTHLFPWTSCTAAPAIPHSTVTPPKVTKPAAHISSAPKSIGPSPLAAHLANTGSSVPAGKASLLGLVLVLGGLALTVGARRYGRGH